jgi:hypothetical protein
MRSYFSLPTGLVTMIVEEALVSSDRIQCMQQRSPSNAEPDDSKLANHRTEGPPQEGGRRVACLPAKGPNTWAPAPSPRTGPRECAHARPNRKRQLQHHGSLSGLSPCQCFHRGPVQVRWSASLSPCLERLGSADPPPHPCPRRCLPLNCSSLSSPLPPAQVVIITICGHMCYN